MANGSFLSEDTYAGNATEPLSLNRYAYVSNNPVNYRDPSGHKRTFSYAMKDAGGGGTPSPSLPQSTVYQPAASQLESAKPKREFEQVAKDAETTGNKPTNSSDKVASGTVEDLKTENEEAKENKGIVATLCDIGSDILQGVVEWFQSEEVQKIIKTIGITVAAVGLALLIGPYIATAIVGVLGLTATTSVTAASIASYMLVAGTTFGTLDSASEGKPFLESLRHGIETGAAWTTIALVLYASYLLVLELIGLVGKITPESIADALDGVYESIQEWFNGDGSNSTTDDIVGDIIEGGTSSLAKYGDDFGKMGTYVENPNIKVDWTQYAEHAAERMQQRGMTQELVENIVENGKVLSQNNGSKYAYITQEGVAVVSNEGKLITAWTSADFDDNMKEIVKKLFGE